MTAQLEPNARIQPRTLLTLCGESVSLPDPTRLVHLQFRRFAGCPVCHLHLREVARREQELEAAGIRELVFFHSSEAELREYQAQLPRYVVADVERRLYREFGVEPSPRALLDPRAYGPILRAVSSSLLRVVRGEDTLRLPRAENGRLGLPADFLLAPDGRLIACKYGQYVDDQWSVDELLALARNPPLSAANVELAEVERLAVD